MVIEASLQDGQKERQVAICFYSDTDHAAAKAGGQGELPQTWVQYSLTQDEARTLWNWLRGDRQTSFQNGSVRVAGSKDHFMLEDQLGGFAMRLSTEAEVKALTKAIGGALSLIMGKPSN